MGRSTRTWDHTIGYKKISKNLIILVKVEVEVKVEAEAVFFSYRCLGDGH